MLSSTLLVSLVAVQVALAAPIAKSEPEVYIDTFKTSAGIACTAATGSEPECVTHYERDGIDGLDIGSADSSGFILADPSGPVTAVILPREQPAPTGIDGLDIGSADSSGFRLADPSGPVTAVILPREQPAPTGTHDWGVAPSLDDLRFGHPVPPLPGKTLSCELPPATSSTPSSGGTYTTTLPADTSNVSSGDELEARQLALIPKLAEGLFDVFNLLSERAELGSLSELD